MPSLGQVVRRKGIVALGAATVLAIASMVSVKECCANSGGDEPPTAEELQTLEKRVIESRTHIRSGRVVVENRYNTFRQDPTYVKNVKRFVIYFEDQKTRADVTTTDGRTTSTCHTIHTPDSFIRNMSPDQWVQLFGPDTRPRTTLEIPDPRRLGLIVWGFDSINQFGFEKHLLRTGRENVGVERDSRDGGPLWNVAYRYMANTEPVFVEYSLSLEQGGLPVFIAVSSKNEGRHYAQSIRCELAQYSNAGIWFPNEVVFRYTQDDDVLVEEVTTVIEAEFGQDIDEETFTLAGLGLANGRGVLSDGHLYSWTPEGLVPQKPEFVDFAQAASKTGGSRRWFLLVNAIVLMAIASAIAYRRLYARR